MRLPDWDAAQIREHKKRWRRLQGYGSKSAAVRSRGMFLGRPRKEPTLHGLLAYLLTTQPDNPVTSTLLRNLEGEKNRRALYQPVDIPKKRGGTRQIHIPHHPLRWVQRSLLQVLTHLFPRHKCAHGFERGKNIVTHARPHVRKRFVYTVDIEDFFPSITWGRLYGMFQAVPFKLPAKVARHLANLTTHEGALPQGAPTSPILANLLCRKLDSRLFQWARNNGYVYTRYADDLSFSTNRPSFPLEDRAFIDQVIKEEGFQVNEEKRRLMPSHGRQMVTGLIVNERVNVPRKYLRELRALLFNVRQFGWNSQIGREAHRLESKEKWDKYFEGDPAIVQEVRKAQSEQHTLLRLSKCLHGVEDAESLRNVIRGRIAFVGQVRGEEDGLYLDLMRRYRKILPSYHRLLGQKKKALEAERNYNLLPAPELESAEPDQKGHYGAYKALERKVEAEDEAAARENKFREQLGTWSEEVLEYRWALDGNTTFEDLKKKARKIAYRASTSTSETARFFREFKRYESFRGLLHKVDVDPEGQCHFDEGTVLEVSEVIGNCRKAVKSFLLPNPLVRATRATLDAADDWISNHPGRHPWNDPDSRPEKLIEYKRNTRFDNTSAEMDLIMRLQDRLDEIAKDRETAIECPEFGPKLHTYVPDVLRGIALLIDSMAQHTRADKITVQATRHDFPAAHPEVVIRIADQGSAIRRKPNLEAILTGDTQGALYKLRGYARWTLRAPFEADDGSKVGSYQFDVMRNRKERLEDELSGVEHLITFYQ